MQLIYISKLGLVDYILCSHEKVLLDILQIFHTLMVMIFKSFFFNQGIFLKEAIGIYIDKAMFKLLLIGQYFKDSLKDVFNKGIIVLKQTNLSSLKTV